MLCALVMAGGKGERFWPLSTDKKPKQFLNLLGDYTMIQMTVKRLEKIIPIERIFIVTAKEYGDLVEENLPYLPKQNIIIEPVGKNTAPCIGLSAFIIDKYYKNSTIAVLPSDHLVEDEDLFRNTLVAAYEFVQGNDEAIVTIGMRPNRPETGYGYIKFNQLETKIDSFEIRKVDKFVEKPNLETAKQYLDEGDFLWNGGMFIWNIRTILGLTEKHLNKTYQVLREIAVTDDDKFDDVLEENYRKIDSISVDYGIMEKSNNIYVIPGDFGWDDVGSWKSVKRIRKKDENGNICSGDVQVIEASNNTVISKSKPIIVAGLEDVFVIESDDVLLISSSNYIENIKEIKAAFNK